MSESEPHSAESAFPTLEAITAPSLGVWITLFCVTLVLRPLALLKGWFEPHWSTPAVGDVTAQMLVIAHRALEIATGVYGFFVGVKLYLRSQGAMTHLLVLWSSVGLYLLLTPPLVSYLGMFELDLPWTLATWGVFLGWWVYFACSKRVKAIFGRKLWPGR